jgi:hypothetical protein
MVVAANEVGGTEELTSPRLGFTPTRWQVAAGVRVDPAPSPACAGGNNPAATAAAAPPLEPLA